MPTTLFFSSGSDITVTADLHELDKALCDGDAVSLQRFAGFRGTEPIGAETVIVRMAAVAYAQSVAAP